MAAAQSAALAAPAAPIANVATGTPAGICTIDSSESSPPSDFDCTGTPSTGRRVLAAVMPGRCAAPPAPGAGGPDAPRPFVPVDVRVPARELGERGRPFRDQSLAPGADLPEALGVAAGARIAGSERSADRFEVDLAHEPADILTLAHGGGAAGDAPRRANRIKERLREFERFELGIAERRERLAQILGGVRGALARALARRLCPGLMG